MKSKSCTNVMYSCLLYESPGLHLFQQAAFQGVHLFNMLLSKGIKIGHDAQHIAWCVTEPLYSERHSRKFSEGQQHHSERALPLNAGRTDLPCTIERLPAHLRTIIHRAELHF